MFVQIYISNMSNLCVVGVCKLWDMGCLQQSSWLALLLDLVMT